jgi:hypothetical protein
MNCIFFGMTTLGEFRFSDDRVKLLFVSEITEALAAFEGLAFPTLGDFETEASECNSLFWGFEAASWTVIAFTGTIFLGGLVKGVVALKGLQIGVMLGVARTTALLCTGGIVFLVGAVGIVYAILVGLFRPDTLPGLCLELASLRGGSMGLSNVDLARIWPSTDLSCAFAELLDTKGSSAGDPADRIGEEGPSLGVDSISSSLGFWKTRALPLIPLCDFDDPFPLPLLLE